MRSNFKGGKVNLGIIGLGFGAEFIPIYQDHPNANMDAICRCNVESLNECGKKSSGSKNATPNTRS